MVDAKTLEIVADLHRPIIKNAYKQLMTLFIIKEMKNDPENVLKYLDVAIDKKAVDYISKSKLFSAYQLSHKTKQDWVFITIFFKKDYPPDKVESIAEKLIALRRWLKSIAVIEQKGESRDTMGHNTHIHLLAKRTSLSASKRLILDAIFTKLLRDYPEAIHSRSSIDLRPKFSRDIDKMANYITGKKADKAKHKAQEIDLVFRTVHNLKLSYRNNFVDYITTQNALNQDVSSPDQPSSPKPHSSNPESIKQEHGD